jgi:hypothetical protein
MAAAAQLRRPGLEVISLLPETIKYLQNNCCFNYNFLGGDYS